MFAPFGSQVEFALLYAEDGDYLLQPAEAACLSPCASPKRRREFALGRAAAQQILRNLGLQTLQPVLQGPSREPIWPAGYLGSIAHTAAAAAAAAAPIGAIKSIGIDLETAVRPGVARLAPRLVTAEELNWVRAEAAAEDLRTLLIFSAKESVFKALFPICQVWFGFQAVSLRWNPERSCFDGILRIDLSAGLPAGFTFQVQVHRLHDLILTGLVIPAEQLD